MHSPIFLVCAVGLLSSTASTLRADVVSVSLNPTTPSFTLGQTFNVDLLADIPDPVLGFGLDMNFAATMLALNGFTTGPLWFPATGVEVNDFVGLAFPTPVSGAVVLLGTFSFTALATGSTALGLAYDSMNFAEGFPLATGGFADNNLPDESAVPEPSTLCLLALCLLAVPVVMALKTLTERRRLSGGHVLER